MSDYPKMLDNALLQKHGVTLYGSDVDMYDIINDFLEDNRSEQAFYVVDLGEIVHAVNQWKTLLPMVTPYYAIKCNPNPVMLEALASLGVNFDCASEAEIKTVIEITKDPTRIIFANPCKMSSQIRYARANDVDCMTFDSEEELYKVKLFHPYAKLILRLAVDDSKSVCKFNKKFGCRVEQVQELLVIAKTLKLNVMGYSFHVGSNCSSEDTYYEALRTVREAVDIAAKLDISITMVDIGGGFRGVDGPSPTGHGGANAVTQTADPGVKFVDIAKKINEGIADFFPNHEEQGIDFMAEPGRYFAQRTHTLIMNVIGKKIIMDNDEKTIVYYLNDGIYGSFNCIMFDHERPTILPFNERNEKQFRSRLFGPTCDSIDMISEDVMLPELATGEWVYSENMGAYTVAAGSNFNGFRTNLFRYILRS